MTKTFRPVFTPPELDEELELDELDEPDELHAASTAEAASSTAAHRSALLALWWEPLMTWILSIVDVEPGRQGFHGTSSPWALRREGPLVAHRS